MAIHNKVQMIYNGIQYDSMAEAFRAANLDAKKCERIRTFLKRHKEYYNCSLEEIMIAVDKHSRDRSRCLFGKVYTNQLEVANHFGISITAIANRSDIELEEYICKNLYYVDGKYISGFKNYCKYIGIDYKGYQTWLRRRGLKDITSEIVIDNVEKYIISTFEYKNNNDITFAAKCRRYGIDKNAAVAYKINHPDLSDEQIIEYYLTRKPSFRSLCVQAGINPDIASNYKRKHPGLSDTEIIIRYNPNCYLNIRGELVIPK